MALAAKRFWTLRRRTAHPHGPHRLWRALRPGILAAGVLLAGLMVTLSAPSRAQEGAGGEVSTAPVLKAGGEKWRLGYMEGGQYPDYELIFLKTLDGLADLGWMDAPNPPADLAAEPGALWRWLAANAQSDYLTFVEDAYYAPGDFDAEQRPAVRDAVQARLREQKDIDLMFALGTWAGQDLAVEGVEAAIMVASASDPVGAGIVQSVEDSGRDNVHAKVEPERYQRQVRIFHDIIGFSKLGIVYTDSVEGRTYGGVDAVEQVADERGFEIVRCITPFSDEEHEAVKAKLEACYEEVAEKADAVYVTVHRGLTEGSLPRVVDSLNAAQVPSFSMLGSSEVRRGILMSVAQADFSYVGRFHAEVIAKIFNGARPRDIDQRWSAPPKIALNLETAEIIGYDPPVDILIASDEIYEAIEKPAEESGSN